MFAAGRNDLRGGKATHFAKLLHAYFVVRPHGLSSLEDETATSTLKAVARISMAPKKRARGADGAAAVSPPKITDAPRFFWCPSYGRFSKIIDKSMATATLKGDLTSITRVTPSHTNWHRFERKELQNAAALVDVDLSRVPEPTGKERGDLFSAEPKSVLFAGGNSTLYHQVLEFDEPVLLTRVIVSGLNLGTTKAKLTVAPSHLHSGAGVCEKQARKSNVFLSNNGIGTPQPAETIFTLEPGGFVGTRFIISEHFVADGPPAGLDYLNWMAAFRSGVKIEYERYTPGVGSAGLHSLGADLAALLDNEDLCDVTFVCSEDSGEVRAVKAVLAARCAYFRTLLFGAHREARQERVNIECSAPALRIVLGFLLTGTGNTALPLQPPEVLVDAHKLADAYLLPALQALCLHALHANLAVDNCQATLLVAHRRGLPDAKNVCLGFMVNNHDETFKDNRLDEIIGANEPGLLREMFAAASEFMAEGENPSLGDHTEHTHF